eukprot:g77114.t1
MPIIIVIISLKHSSIANLLINLLYPHRTILLSHVSRTMTMLHSSITVTPSKTAEGRQDDIDDAWAGLAVEQMIEQRPELGQIEVEEMMKLPPELVKWPKYWPTLLLFLILESTSLRSTASSTTKTLALLSFAARLIVICA